MIYKTIEKTFETIAKESYTYYSLYIIQNNPTNIYTNDNNKMDDFLYNVGIIYLQGYKNYLRCQRIFKLLKKNMKNDPNYQTATQELSNALNNRRR